MGSLPPYQKPWITTPLVYSTALSRSAGCHIYLKLECLQPSGSFKSRGIGNLLLQSLSKVAPEEAANTHFFSSSGGNAGLGCVHAAATLGSRSTVVVPLSTSQYMISKLRAAGADRVLQHGKSWAEADGYLKDVVIPYARDDGIEPVYVHPFDEEVIWEGHATLVDELVDQLKAATPFHGDMAALSGNPDLVICSVGGGGLLCGIVRGLDRNGLGKTTKVLALETDGADSLNQAIAKRELVTLPSITSIAGSLGARTVCKQALEYGLGPNVISAVLSDAEAAMGSVRFADDERILVESACGICIATCYNGRLKQMVPDLTPESNVVIVVCGGSNVTTEMFEKWKRDWGQESFRKETARTA